MVDDSLQKVEYVMCHDVHTSFHDGKVMED